MPAVAGKVATVDMGKLYNAYAKTKEIKDQSVKDAGKIREQNEVKVKAIQKIADEMKKLQAKMSDPTLAPDKKADMQKQLEFIARQGNMAEQRRQIWVGQRNRAINENYVAEMKKLLAEIRAKVADYAKSNDITTVYEKSAMATSGTKILVFSKDKYDITTDLLEIINKEEE
eukprot:Seg14153.3 transcript_id=Seg14153.3/GoldUCD/mRNA.D3Y31 product="hypothetical protein" protein_id=Seg14153.3/GoldUCD/D3Y31